uniref:Uncharacterized protein n=1 Tax=Myotis myotis TaxID=51298 RepID=A0A7J7UCJ5_MYOMY|nr:hypothetical protein mMyoMyo1_008711 [Myotis myotis]
MYKTVALLRQTFHLVLYRDTNEELELWGMRQRKALKRGELTLLNAMELNNLRILDPEKLSRWSSLRFSRNCWRQHVSRGWNVVLWSQARPRGCVPIAATRGALPALAGSLMQTRSWSPARSLSPRMWPLPVRWAVESASASRLPRAGACGRRLITVLVHLLVTTAGQDRDGLGAPWCTLKSLSFTFIFQKIEVTVASLLSPPPCPPLLPPPPWG